MHFLKSQLPLLLAALAAASVIDVHVTTPADISTAPYCYWEGTSPICKGQCKNGFIETARTKCGDGKCCLTGSKALCCPPSALMAALHITGDAPYDEYCDDGFIIQCPEDATDNSDCECVPDTAAQKAHHGRNRGMRVQNSGAF